MLCTWLTDGWPDQSVKILLPVRKYFTSGSRHRICAPFLLTSVPFFFHFSLNSLPILMKFGGHVAKTYISHHTNFKINPLGRNQNIEVLSNKHSIIVSLSLDTGIHTFIQCISFGLPASGNTLASGVYTCVQTGWDYDNISLFLIHIQPLVANKYTVIIISESWQIYQKKITNNIKALIKKLVKLCSKMI